jgi:uncharacterized lipoprotein YajG
MRGRFLPLALTLALTSGCAFTRAELDVHLDGKDARRGPLSSVQPPLQFELAEFTDSRSDPARIGFKQNMYGQNTADIVTLQPVTQVVRDAVRMTLEKNGHAAGTNSPVRIEGDVQQFWFNLQINFWTIEFMGTTACKLKVSDAASGGLIYEANYTGHYNEKSAGGYEGSWQRVMNLSLARLVESIAMDDALTKALSVPRPAAVPTTD